MKKDKKEPVAQIFNDSIAPKGEDKEIILDPANKHILKERGIEAVRTMMDRISTDQDFNPIVIGKVDGEMLVMPLENKNGKYTLPNLKAVSEKEFKKKEKMARKIVKKIHPVLQRDIGNITFIAMLRKPLPQLKRIYKKINNENTKLANRIGCIFLEVEEESIQI